MFNILLLDDEELALTTLRCGLPWKEYGFTEIYSSTDAHEALALFEQQHFDACFIDICMPNINGLDFIAAAQKVSPDTYFVVISGYSDFAYAKQAIKYGVVDYCLKPVSQDEYAPTLEKLSKLVMGKRMAADPIKVSALLSDSDACQKLISQLQGNSPDVKELSLLLIRSSTLSAIVQEAAKVIQGRFMFLGPNECCLISPSIQTGASVIDFAEKWHNDALFIFDTTPTRAKSFQSTLKRLRVTCSSQSESTTGLIQLNTVNEETAVYFTKVLSYIDENYASPLDLQELAQKYGLNYSYLSQLFKKAIGVSFVEHLTNIRLTHACSMLSETYISVADIAEAVGFRDYHYFCSTFKRYYGVTPSQYRRSVRNSKKAGTKNSHN